MWFQPRFVWLHAFFTGVSCIPHGIAFSCKRLGNDIRPLCLVLNINPYKPKPYKYLMLSTFTTFFWRGKEQFLIDGLYFQTVY